MSQFELHESPENGVELSFEEFLYNQESFLKSNNDLPLKYFYCLDKKSGGYVAHIAFTIQDGVAVSPLKAPFGGVEVAERLTNEEIGVFLTLVEDALKSDGVLEIRIHQAPESYQKQEVLVEAMIDSGYEEIQERIYHGIDIDEIPLSEKMVDMQRRRLKKCAEAGFVFKKYSKSELAAAFEQIDRWRTAAEKPLSMTWADLHNSSKRNPKTYHAFGIENEHGLMIAGTIVVRVNDKVLYNFFPASYDVYNQYSPMVMLVNMVYAWGKGNGYTHLDLGTSYVHKNVNASLRVFKERLGGKPYSAWSWRKKLN
ncbi:MAG: GNAT family N-acetyltransferase [Cytophagia bacterium]|nr:GNAT family N-acetyltransferase [Cytophagia bacterium]